MRSAALSSNLYRAAIALLLILVGSGRVAAAEPEEKEQSLTEINKQLTNPVTSIWSLTFQFNNYILENDHWNHNLQFQPVLPVSLTENWNLISRPVIPSIRACRIRSAPAASGKPPRSATSSTWR